MAKKKNSLPPMLSMLGSMPKGRGRPASTKVIKGNPYASKKQTYAK